MSISIALVCEGVSDPPTICALADRVILAGVTWIDSDEIDTHRHFRGFQPTDPYLTWFDIDNLAKQFRVRSHGHLTFGLSLHGDGHQVRKAMALLIFHTPEDTPVDAIIFFRDGDREYIERVEAMQKARDNPIAPLSDTPIIIGVANRMRECWVINGFEPADERERTLLDAEHQRLGFDPRFRAHELTATNESLDRSPKRVLRALAGDDQERERRCVYHTSLDTLRMRGAETGLPEFLDELKERLIAAFR
jgi:hypothetical protein